MILYRYMRQGLNFLEQPGLQHAYSLNRHKDRFQLATCPAQKNDLHAAAVNAGQAVAVMIRYYSTVQPIAWPAATVDNSPST